VSESVRFAIDERGVATITLARPARLNAINLRMRDLLWEYLGAADAIPETRVIVFNGEGPHFCAGADISEFGTAPSIMAARRARHDRDIWWQLLTHRCVTIARMHGYCYGAGLELPLFCDLRIASTDARVALPEVTLGYIPSAGATQLLPRLAPPGVAAQLILSGEPIGADAALRWGIVDDVVAPDALDAAITAAVARALVDPAGVRQRRLHLIGSPDTPGAAFQLP
jgi:enoyl-CoA hydratase/carnithine racemase